MLRAVIKYYTMLHLLQESVEIAASLKEDPNETAVGDLNHKPLQLPAHLLQVIYIGPPSLKALAQMQPLHSHWKH